MVHSRLTQHCVILDLTLPKLWRVCADDDQLCFPLSKGFQRGTVTQSVLSTLHHQSQSRIDALVSLLFNWSHFVFSWWLLWWATWARKDLAPLAGSALLSEVTMPRLMSLMETFLTLNPTLSPGIASSTAV